MTHLAACKSHQHPNYDLYFHIYKLNPPQAEDFQVRTVPSYSSMLLSMRVVAVELVAGGGQNNIY
jgi:hypothetical protein